MTTIKAIAFYLPQFHPIAENDEWWGKGFTEWTNVTKAKPLFPGHYQPHLPADLGFYDLRIPEVRQAQADLARQYGIHGFCYYHYWFHGKRLLERPFNEVLESGQPDFPFCLCWANENWTRRWDGKEKELLIEQKYSEEDDRQHIQWLAGVFADPRYIRVNNKPLFLVYHAYKLPNPLKTAAIWREECQKLGIGEIVLARVQSSPRDCEDPRAIGFDISVEFQPEWTRLKNRLPSGLFGKIRRELRLVNPAYRDNLVYDYANFVKRMLDKEAPNYPLIPCIVPSWDNSARRSQKAAIFKNSSPQIYQGWLEKIVERELSKETDEEKIIFINAWNEWAEGNHLEPCRKWELQYLEATREVLKKVERYPPAKS
jgi:lipopolysaccharide biosynthesis protein